MNIALINKASKIAGYLIQFYCFASIYTLYFVQISRYIFADHAAHSSSFLWDSSKALFYQDTPIRYGTTWLLSRVRSNCSVHAWVRQKYRSKSARWRHDESAYSLVSFNFALLLFVFLDFSLPRLPLLLSFDIPHCDRLKFRWKSHSSLPSSRCASEYRS